MTAKIDAGAMRSYGGRQAASSPLLDEPPIGHLQVVVLKKLDDLGREAFGYRVLEELSADTGVWVDHSQIYSSIRKLLNRKPEPYIVHTETRKSTDGGPPFKVYKLTPAGRAALKATAAHHAAVSEFLAKTKRS